ncbi:MAG TPA: GGDEF domain-containing protein [Acetobacteraceae bacterium]|nr:GGDEF domain-containing protein [Acetobacteraceae bacterium]
MDVSGPPGMIAAALDELCGAAELEGAAILDMSDRKAGPVLLHAVGLSGPGITTAAGGLLGRSSGKPLHGIGADRRPILVCPWALPPARPGGLVLWRMPGSRTWDQRDHVFAASVGGLIRVMMEHGSPESAIDRLTGVPNRRWFMDEAERHIDRLDRDGLGGTLILLDIDDLKRVNEAHGRDAGDRVLVRAATLLRTMVRPSDPVARVGPDEFAVWLDGMDHMTAAERGEALCAQTLNPGGGDGAPDRQAVARFTLSIGIASRSPGGDEDIRALLRRAQMAGREIKQEGGNGWRVSRAGPPVR